MLQIWDLIKTCKESLVFQAMANMEKDNVRRKNLSNILPSKLLPLTKYVPTPSEYLLNNYLNERLEKTKTSQQMLVLFFFKQNLKKHDRFPKNQNIRTAA